MKKNDVIERWHDSAFIEKANAYLDALFVIKRLEGEIDLQGLIVGLDGAIAPLVPRDLQDVIIASVDLSHSRFSCSFSRGQFSAVSFSEAQFDTCRFGTSRFYCCNFTKARLESPTLDDAVFIRCCFAQAQIRGRGWNEYGGKRALFENCNFSGTKFLNLQFRGCSFVACTFEGALFSKCLLSGAKFVNGTPASTAFHGCQVS